MLPTSILKTLIAAGALAASANASIFWVDWTQQTANGVIGTLLVNGTTVNVTYTGEVAFAQTSGGTYYYTGNPSPYTSATVPNPPPDSDIIALSQATVKNLTFSQPIDGLLFAVVSLNGNGYRFDRDFNILSFACGYWGCGTLAKNTSTPGVFELDGTGEPHGVIQFQGSTSSITWTSLTAEYWNGFTIGVAGLAVTGVPEPSTMYLGLGLLPILAALRRRKR